jgi:hypothetical protein
MSVDFRITTQSGEVVDGQIKAYGGMVGGGYAYRGPEVENAIALEGMRNTIALLTAKNQWRSEASEVTGMRGHCEVYPVFKISNKQSSDERILQEPKLVDLNGARIEILTM